MHEVAIVGEEVAGRAAEVRKELKRMVLNMAVSTFDMIELLREATEYNYPQQWGFDSVLHYGLKELGLKKRKTQYLTRIGTVCKAVGLQRAQYEPAGVSKLREITRLDPEGKFFNKDTYQNEDMADHIVRLILDHDKLNVEQTKEEVARLLGQTGGNQRVTRSYSTDLNTWQNVISVAIEKARRYLGSKGRDESGQAKEYSEGECYECICATFNADPNYQDDPEDTLTIDEVLEGHVEAPTLPMEEI